MTDILVSKDDGQVVTLTLNDAPANLPDNGDDVGN